MASISGLNFDAAVEPKPLPKARYEVQITSAEEKESGAQSKNPGAPMIVVNVGFTGPSEEEQNAPAIRHYISLPSENDEQKTVNFKLLLLKRFMAAFGIAIPKGTVELDTERLCFDLAGRSATLEVGLTEPNANGDVYNTLVLPRLQDEETAGRSTGKRRG